MSDSVSPQAASRIAMYAPALLGASSFACADVLMRFPLRDGAGVLTVSTLRGVLGLAMMCVWLALVPRPPAAAPAARWISLGVGVLFTANVYLLFKAIEVVTVPIAILTYFVYPLATGLAAAATGLDKLTWRGLTAAVVAFVGLALMIGAYPSGLANLGIVAALAAAGCRVLMLLITRAKLGGTDPRIITWYSMVSSTALFVAISVLSREWHPPTSVFGWTALVALSFAVTAGILGVFASTAKVGPFRTALFMNLEPPLTVLGSALFLGEVISPLEGLGAAVMLVALLVFQLRK
ncbi:MAG: DMT family transporter [Xanthobacteraceae bacterium]